MAGIYVHIPFCKKKCFYCDFYSTINLQLIDKYVDTLISEIKLKKYNLTVFAVSTVYFGGGTPTLLSINQLDKILTTIKETFRFTEKQEFTIECNPDDLDKDYLLGLKKIGFNRLSIGVQSLDDGMLSFLNRRHNSEQAINSVLWAKEVGFENISVDFIYGIAGQTEQQLENELNTLLSLPITHFSAYCLELENKSVLNKLRELNKFSELEDYIVYRHYLKVLKCAKSYNFSHYEISNYAKKGFESKHNKNYWSFKAYLGLGPSAHSYYGKKRCWNAPTLDKYFKQIEIEENFYDCELLTIKDSYNEFLMLSLRMKSGISKKILSYFPYKEKTISILRKMNKKYLKETQRNFYFTDEGMFTSDYFVSALFV